MARLWPWIDRVKHVGLIAVLVLAASVGCTVLSIFLVRIPDLQTPNAGNAGQAFGAAAAASSTVVLYYMARTMRMQKQESEDQRAELRLSREVLLAQCQMTGQSNGELHRTSEALVRGLHMSLMRMAIEDPELAAIWPLYDPGAPPAQNKQFFYVNLALSQHLLMYETGYAEDHVEASLCRFFGNSIWRKFWEMNREARAAIIPAETTEGRFSVIAERAYQAAALATPLRRQA